MFLQSAEVSKENICRPIGNLSCEDREQAKRIADETAAAKEVAKKLETISLELNIEVGTNGRAFGSISSKEISEGLSKLKFDIDKKKFELDNPIKGEGEYTVPVRLYKGVIGKVKVSVRAVLKK